MKRIFLLLVTVIVVVVGANFLFGTNKTEVVNNNNHIEVAYKSAKTIEDYQDFIDDYYYENNEGTQSYVADSMLKLALIYADQNNIKDELQAYNKLIKRFVKSTNHKIKKSVVQAMINKAKREVEQNQQTLALNTYTEIITTFKHSKNTEVCALVLEAEREKDHLRQELSRTN